MFYNSANQLIQTDRFINFERLFYRAVLFQE